MGRWTILLVILFYFVAAIMFGIYLQLRTPFSTLNVISVSEAVGRGFAVWIISGVLPTIFWSFRRFRSKNAVLPLVLWAICGVLVASLMGIGERVATDKRIDDAMTRLTGNERTTFAQGAMRGCIREQMRDPSNRKIGITDEQIESYCHCFAGLVANNVGAEDLRDIAHSGKLSEELKRQLEDLGAKCRQGVLGIK